MTHPSDLILSLSQALARIQFPHKEWALLTDEEKGFYIQDVLDFLAATSLAGYTLSNTLGGNSCP